MVDKINEIFKPYGICVDFEKDVVPLSKYHEGGSVTERHVSYALSARLIEKFGKGRKLLDFLKDDLKLNISSKIEKLLSDVNNTFYEYDLLGLIKGELVPMFYIDATAECPDVREVIGLSGKIGAISAYAYLGDVGDSVTGDKKAQKFEDDYLDLVFEVIRKLGFNAVTYMPSRNTMQQLKRVKALCETHGFFQISGEDINSPRQSFICEAQRDEEFKNLLDSTWALIGHEKAATEELENGMFSKKTIEKYPDLNERIKVFAEIGKK